MKTISIILSVVLGLHVFAQNTEKKLDDSERITLAAYVPQRINDMPEDARATLSNKLNQLISQNGFAGSTANERFILTSNIVLLSKDITATAPVMHAYTLEVSLYIGDALEGKKFASHSVKLKGVGETETKAYLAALKNLKTSDKSYQEFIETGKKRILEYFNSQCEFIIKEAQSYESRNQYEVALYQLTSVPTACKECYDKCINMVGPIYQKQIDRQCKKELIEATSVWNSTLNAEGAEMASRYLANIEPNSSCYKDAQALVKEIGKRIKELDQREWNFKLKQQQDNVDIQKATIKAARDIGVAYGNNQPDVRYETVIYGWW
jgi:hypothetical protein